MGIDNSFLSGNQSPSEKSKGSSSQLFKMKYKGMKNFNLELKKGRVVLKKDFKNIDGQGRNVTSSLPFVPYTRQHHNSSANDDYYFLDKSASEDVVSESNMMDIRRSFDKLRDLSKNKILSGEISPKKTIKRYMRELRQNGNQVQSKYETLPNMIEVRN